jgi:hypothetical protein
MLGGLKSLMPGVNFRGVGGASARYVYAVWARHLATMAEHGVDVPRGTVVELGPGDTLGLCLAALLTGSATAVALDVVRHVSAAQTRQIFADLVALYRARAPLPADDELPRVYPRMTGPRELSRVVDEATLAAALTPERVARIAERLEAAVQDSVQHDTHDDGARGDGDQTGAVCLRYTCPWTASSVRAGTADVVVSQSALEYLPHESGSGGLSAAFASMRRWLRVGGVISHQINLASPFGREWNAHWAVGDAAWRIVRGRRPHYENRVPLSEYVRLCADHGFKVLVARVTHAPEGVARGRLAPRFRELAAEDYTATNVHLLARKR